MSGSEGEIKRKSGMKRVTMKKEECEVDEPVSLCHAGVVDHEEVHLEVVCTRPLDLVVLCN